MPLTDADLRAEIERLREPLQAAAPGTVPQFTAVGLAKMIDHTLLKAAATADQIIQLCAEARQYGFATVCVNPAWVPLCAAQLKDSGVEISTVIGFPLGATLAEAKLFEAERSLDYGASELDMVINIGSLKSGRYGGVEAEIAAIVEAAHLRSARVKVIIETAYLTLEEKVAAVMICRTAQADFTKTSTGFAPTGATEADVALMRRVGGSGMGVKAAGGIRTLADAQNMVAAGASRLGTSAGAAILRELEAAGQAAGGEG